MFLKILSISLKQEKKRKSRKSIKEDLSRISNVIFIHNVQHYHTNNIGRMKNIRAAISDRVERMLRKNVRGTGFTARTRNIVSPSCLEIFTIR